MREWGEGESQVLVNFGFFLEVISTGANCHLEVHADWHNTGTLEWLLLVSLVVEAHLECLEEKVLRFLWTMNAIESGIYIICVAKSSRQVGCG